MSRDIADAQWRLSIVSMSTWGLGDNISEPVRDRYLDPINHQYEMAYWDWNGHGTVDVTWPRKVKVRSNIFGAHYFDNGWGYGLGANGAPIRNGYLGIKWSRDRRRRVTQKGQGLDPNMLKVQYLERGWKYRLGEMKHLREMGYGESNGRVTDVVTWPWKIEVVTTICLVPIISKTAGDRYLVPKTMNR